MKEIINRPNRPLNHLIMITDFLPIQECISTLPLCLLFCRRYRLLPYSWTVWQTADCAFSPPTRPELKHSLVPPSICARILTAVYGIYFWISVAWNPIVVNVAIRQNLLCLLKQSYATGTKTVEIMLLLLRITNNCDHWLGSRLGRLNFGDISKHLLASKDAF